MKKLKLELESLEVESFSASRKEEARGTVAGHGQSSDGPWGCLNQCHGNNTDLLCNTDFMCASEVCSGRMCNSLSGCVSYENTCFCEP